MKYLWLLPFIATGACSLVDSQFQNKTIASNSCPTVQIQFSPKGGVTENIVKTIGKARKSVRVQAYSFTSMPIAEALVNQKKAGKVVEVVLDRSNMTGKGSVLDFLNENGIPCWIDSRHAIAHNKIIVIDETVTFTGSFNFTNAAENSNAENSLMITDSEIGKLYTQNIKDHMNHSDGGK